MTSQQEDLEQVLSKTDGAPAKKVTAVVVGCGSRGQGYSAFALDFPKRLQIVGVAEPVEHRRRKMQKLYGLKDEQVFDDWNKMAEADKMADCAFGT